MTGSEIDLLEIGSIINLKVSKNRNIIGIIVEIDTDIDLYYNSSNRLLYNVLWTDDGIVSWEYIGSLKLNDISVVKY